MVRRAMKITSNSRVSFWTSELFYLRYKIVKDLVAYDVFENPRKELIFSHWHRKKDEETKFLLRWNIEEILKP